MKSRSSGVCGKVVCSGNSTSLKHRPSQNIISLQLLCSQLKRPLNDNMDSKPRINFIERNRQNIGQRKLSGKSSSSSSSFSSSSFSSSSKSTRSVIRPPVPPDPAPAPALAEERKKDFIRPASSSTSRNQVVEKSGVKKSQANARPATSTAARRTKISVGRPKEEETDLVTKMTRMNLLEQLLRIFLPLDSETLTACREVCKSWNRFFRLVFWREVRVRNEMLRRLEDNWRNKRYYKVRPRIERFINKTTKCSG